MPGIRHRLEIVNDPLLDIQGFYADFDQITSGIAETVFRRVEPIALSEARYEPGPAVLPFEFGSAKSKRYYHWAVRTGRIKTAGGRYQRSHKVSQSWTYRLLKTPEGAQFVLSNGVLEAKYVVGSFDQARDYQVPGHAASGWVPIRETADFIDEMVWEEYRKEFDRVIPQEYGRARANRRNR